MKRRIFNIFAAISLVLCLALLVMRFCDVNSGDCVVTYRLAAPSGRWVINHYRLITPSGLPITGQPMFAVKSPPVRAVEILGLDAFWNRGTIDFIHIGWAIFPTSPGRTASPMRWSKFELPIMPSQQSPRDVSHELPPFVSQSTGFAWNPQNVPRWWSVRPWGHLRPDFARFGFAHSSVSWQARTSARDAPTWDICATQTTIPIWSIIVLLSILPAIWITLAIRRLQGAIRDYRAQSRIARGLCPICGYDLRASPDRCPECGTEAHASAPNR